MIITKAEQHNLLAVAQRLLQHPTVYGAIEVGRFMNDATTIVGPMSEKIDKIVGLHFCHNLWGTFKT